MAGEGQAVPTTAAAMTLPDQIEVLTLDTARWLRDDSTEALMAAAKGAGAQGAKACGAGGGGCLAFLVREGTRLDVEAALEREGARVLPAHPVERGHILEVEG